MWSSIVTTLTRALGAFLIVVGIVAYVATAAASITALLPAFLGVPILVLGLLAGRGDWHRHVIHAALLLALLGFLGTLRNVADVPAVLGDGDVERPVAVWTSTVTALACLAYVVAGVRSFVLARRAREPAGSDG